MQEVCDGGKQQGLTWNFQTYLLPLSRKLKQIAAITVYIY